MISSQASASGDSNLTQVIVPTTSSSSLSTTSTSIESAFSIASSASFGQHERDYEVNMPNNYGSLDEQTAESSSIDEQTSLRAHLQSVDVIEGIKSGEHEQQRQQQQQRQSELFQSNKRRKQQNPSRKQSGEWSSGSDIETPENEQFEYGEGE